MPRLLSERGEEADAQTKRMQRHLDVNRGISTSIFYIGQIWNRQGR